MVDATRAIIADARMIADSDRWFRNSSAEIDAHRDGPTLEAAGLPFLTLTFARLFPVSARRATTPGFRKRATLRSAPRRCSA